MADNLSEGCGGDQPRPDRPPVPDLAQPARSTSKSCPRLYRRCHRYASGEGEDRKDERDDVQKMRVTSSRPRGCACTISRLLCSHQRLALEPNIHPKCTVGALASACMDITTACSSENYITWRSHLHPPRKTLLRREWIPTRQLHCCQTGGSSNSNQEPARQQQRCCFGVGQVPEHQQAAMPTTTADAPVGEMSWL